MRVLKGSCTNIAGFHGHAAAATNFSKHLYQRRANTTSSEPETAPEDISPAHWSLSQEQFATVVKFLQEIPQRSQRECIDWVDSTYNVKISIGGMIKIARLAGRKKIKRQPRALQVRIVEFWKKYPFADIHKMKSMLAIKRKLSDNTAYRLLRTAEVPRARKELKKRILDYWEANPKMSEKAIKEWALETLAVDLSILTFRMWAYENPRIISQKHELKEKKRESVLEFFRKNLKSPEHLQEIADRAERELGTDVNLHTVRLWARNEGLPLKKRYITREEKERALKFLEENYALDIGCALKKAEEAFGFKFTHQQARQWEEALSKDPAPKERD